MQSIKKILIILFVSLAVMASFVSSNFEMTESTHFIQVADGGGGFGRGEG